MVRNKISERSESREAPSERFAGLEDSTATTNEDKGEGGRGRVS